MYKIIRCGSNYELVIVVTPADADPDTKEAKFYRLAFWPINGYQPGIFHEISRNCAIGYFSGQADGLGWQYYPDEPFESLEAVLAYVNQCRQAGIKNIPTMTTREWQEKIKDGRCPLCGGEMVDTSAVIVYVEMDLKKCSQCGLHYPAYFLSLKEKPKWLSDNNWDFQRILEKYIEGLQEIVANGQEAQKKLEFIQLGRQAK